MIKVRISHQCLSFSHSLHIFSLFALLVFLWLTVIVLLSFSASLSRARFLFTFITYLELLIDKNSKHFFFRIPTKVRLPSFFFFSFFFSSSSSLFLFRRFMWGEKKHVRTHAHTHVLATQLFCVPYTWKKISFVLLHIIYPSISKKRKRKLQYDILRLLLCFVFD